MVNISKDFCVLVGIEKCRLVPINGISTPLANAAIETAPVITIDVIRPASITPMNVLNHFTFFPTSHKFQFLQANMPQFQLIFSRDMFVCHIVAYSGSTAGYDKWLLSNVLWIEFFNVHGKYNAEPSEYFKMCRSSLNLAIFCATSALVI